MTLEVLFAKSSQGRTFLLLMGCGLIVGVLIQLAGLLHRVHRLPGLAADLLCALILTASAAQILRQSGEGLRLYGLLGLCIGGAIAFAISKVLRMR